MNLLNNKIIFVGGKGGVGKTTTASALAYHSSQLNRKTLLISTDPAHSSSDIFDCDLSGGEKIALNPYLDVIELNPDREMANYLNEVKSNLLHIVSSPIILEEVEKQIDLAKITPGAEESALFNRFSLILINEKENYDHLIFDTAPSGHTLRMLSLPHLMGSWIEGLVKKRKKSNKLKEMWETFQQKEKKEDPVLEILEKRKNQFVQTQSILTNNELTSIYIIMIPEKLSLLESSKAIKIIEDFHISLSTIVINRVLPDKIKDPFFKEKIKSEKKYIDEITKTFPKKNINISPLLNEEIVGIPKLSKFMSSIYKIK